jgi:hypothetical protein
MVPVDPFGGRPHGERRHQARQPRQVGRQGHKGAPDVLEVDEDTLFLLQGALEHEVTQALFIGGNTLLAEVAIASAAQEPWHITI